MGLWTILWLLLWVKITAAQEAVHFPSLDAYVGAQPATMLDGYLYRAPGSDRRAAVVFLHGCGGLFNSRTNTINTREQAWAATLNQAGYSVLMVDSFRPRGVSNMCSPDTYNAAVFEKRPRDAYGAFEFLQSQAFVRPDRIAVIGWSEGGGAVLGTVSHQGASRPPALPLGDFRAAVAFYPARCNIDRQPASWISAIPLMVLVGASDVWTPAAPCQSFLGGAIARGAPIEMQIYPGAYHDFDWPDLPLRQLPQYRTRAGVIPITGTEPAARQDALTRVPAFLARYLDR
jgi:dienelactone hydrolase